ncbi:MAG TPA: chemotaxis protein CheW [Spirochaetota bacterium]|nr:chemotaxis protein CheW [Spirochaetota bacterium]HPF06499.1 chemotaxis protein CheW [Spirochaetota bacterium]HPJ43419.1 chemotaxis protein CheW [Spirochaetota bacterium]HPR37768.1 chemotaxis protein CheW [Spirochaetota bacterium]HRX47923.1 chemotaxis protein CheW [Spirochaetota bacterium]
MSFSLGEYQDIFLEEADELLQELNKNLLVLERNPEDDEIINNIFRAAHSLKSSAAFVGLNDLSDLAHRMENLLQGIRDKTNSVTPEVVDVIFKCFDVINEVIELVASGVEPQQNLKPLQERINQVNDNSKIGNIAAGDAGTPGTPGKQAPAKAVIKTTFNSAESGSIRDSIAQGKECLEITVVIEETAQMKWVKSQLISTNLERNGDVIKIIPALEELSADETLNSFKIIYTSDSPLHQIYKGCDIDQIEKIELRRISTVMKDGRELLKIGSPLEVEISDNEKPSKPETVNNNFDAKEILTYDEEPDDAQDEGDDADVNIFERRRSDTPVDHDRRKTPMLKTVKVSIDKLDLLLNNVGELVIANSGFYRLYEELRKYSGNKSVITEFKNRMEQMSRIAKDLQTGIMKTRMVPIGQVFSRFNRLVRDLAKEHNKNVELVVKGEDTELDKKVIDVIGEPLLHLIRNAVDHGIESAEERARLGKPETATITLNAYQGGNQIFVEISDDGRGLDPEAIKTKVVEKKLSTPEILANMDDMDIFNFIFIPGFSTAKIITDISGRGVGMNVVKEIVNELNGTVSIETEKGMGTRFILTFPLTLAIIPAIMVKVRREVYAIPLSDVIETIKISQTDIATIEGHEVINLRGEILSLLRLNEFIGIKTALRSTEKIPVVVVGYGSRKIGLIVDFLEGKMEIVIKSLEQNYTTVEGLAGASILGDGSICLILDIQAMINKVINQQEKLSQEERENVIKSRMVDAADYEELEEEDKVISSAEADYISRGEELSPSDDIRLTETPTEAKGKPNYISDVFLFDEDEGKAEDSEISAEPGTEEEKISEEAAAEPEEISVEKHEITAAVDAVAELAAEPVDSELEEKVKGALTEFREELKQNIDSAISQGKPDSHIQTELNIDKDELNEFSLISNMGAANAAEAISKILSKRIDLSIPEVRLTPVEKIPEFLGGLNEPYIGVMLGIEGEINGTLLLLLTESVGFDLVDMLYGLSTKSTKELSEDGVSALKELTNIIGASILNVYAEKSNMIVKPNVPIFVHDFLQSVVDSVLVMHNIEHDYAIVMETAFYFEDDQVMGNLMILPETESLKLLVKGFKSNV